jgi:hypothetical protein
MVCAGKTDVCSPQRDDKKKLGTRRDEGRPLASGKFEHRRRKNKNENKMKQNSAAIPHVRQQADPIPRANKANLRLSHDIAYTLNYRAYLDAVRKLGM